MPAPQHKAHKPRGKATKAKKTRQAKLGLSHRVSVKAPKLEDKQTRLAAAKRTREQKREQLLATKRHPQVHITCALLPLSLKVNCQGIWNVLLESFNCQDEKENVSEDEVMDSDVQHHPMKSQQVQIQHGKQRTKLFMIPPPLNLHDPLEIVQVARSAELVMFAVDGDCDESQSVDSVGEMILSVVCGMGMPSIMALVNPKNSQKLKDRAQAKRIAIKAVQSRTAQEPKPFVISTKSDVGQLVRSLVELRPKIPNWRSQRPSVLVTDGTYDQQGTLQVCGHTQGCALSVNQLITLPGIGDHQISKIVVPRNQFKTNYPQQSGDDIILVPGKQQHDNQRFNESGMDLMEEEERSDVDMVQSMYSGKQMVKRKLPVGTSDYQAAWYPEDWDDYSSQEEVESLDGDDEAPEVTRMDEQVSMGGDDDDGMTYAETEMEVDVRQAKEEEKKKREEEDQEFPDEMDTPLDISARQRFAKFRNLQSFRTSKWDTKENLPVEYNQIFAFENFKRTLKAAKHQQYQADFHANIRIPSGNSEIQQTANMDDDISEISSSVKPGIFVRIYFKSIDAQHAEKFLQRAKASQSSQTPPMTIFGLLHHESKITLTHFQVRKHHSYNELIANKEELFFVVGGRGFRARPVVSQDAHNADKFKMDRYIRSDMNYVVSVYAPICFPPLPVLAFKVNENQNNEIQIPQLALTGTVKTCDPERVVLKKVILSGYPIKIHKITSIIKYMFFNVEDIKWFKPVELWTKLGKRGLIKDSVGTHGRMKCVFNEPLTSNDTVCMSLYKRAFPKRWQEGETFAEIAP